MGPNRLRVILAVLLIVVAGAAYVAMRAAG